MARTYIISRRTGSGGTAQLEGELRWFVASVPGGKGDLELAVLDGVFQKPVPLKNRDWELFDYSVGAASGLAKGFGWNGAATFVTPFLARIADEFFDTYSIGSATPAEWTGCAGWSEAPIIGAGYVRHVAEEQFESYPDGAAIAADLTGGTGWSGTPLIIAS